MLLAVFAKTATVATAVKQPAGKRKKNQILYILIIMTSSRSTHVCVMLNTFISGVIFPVENKSTWDRAEQTITCMAQIVIKALKQQLIELFQGYTLYYS